MVIIRKVKFFQVELNIFYESELFFILVFFNNMRKKHLGLKDFYEHPGYSEVGEKKKREQNPPGIEP